MDLLLELVKSLNVEAGFERSFKIAKGTLLQNRFLLGVSKESVGQGAEDRLTQVCSRLGMSKTLMDTFTHYLPRADYVHFGFEQARENTLYKVYLEFRRTAQEEIDKSSYRPDPRLLHLGLKWDVADPARHAVTRYTWFPWLSFEEILQRVSHILDSAKGAAARQAAAQLVSLAQARISERDFLFLEVTEEENPRRSFDLNVYRANLQLAEVYPLLSMLCRRHLVGFDTFHTFYNPIKTKKFGHLAAGVDREENSFFTVYYGVEGAFGDSPRREARCDEESGLQTSYGLPARKRRFKGIEEADEKAGYLVHLVKNLGMQTAFERSFKFLDGVLLADRFLLGFRRQASIAEQDDAILNVCRQIDMPEDYRAMFRSMLHEAHIVLFGFEKNEKNRIFKAYLEFNDRLKKAVNQIPKPESVIMHSGFKWDVSDNSRKAAAEYRVFHVLRAADMAARVLRDFYGNKRTGSYRIVDDMLDLAGSRTRPGELLYFEVSEEGNVRRSFDINMYRADLQMAELYPLLIDTARRHCVHPARFEDCYEAVNTHKLGHVSGGFDREGRDFLTIYFSEKGSTRR